MVGVLGASTMTIMKGPVKSMAEVTKRTVAENSMIAAARLAIVAVRQQPNEDCDADDFIEPLEWAPPDGSTGTPPTGGGFLPTTTGATRTDPWGTTYGYCAWDHGTVTDHPDCGGGSQKRLTGENTESKAVIAVISAGPDRVFQTGCGDTPDYVERVSGSDDLVLEYTYAQSAGIGGGLWNVKQGDLETAEIDKNLEVKNEANTVVMAFDQTSDTSKPSLKVDFISKLSAARKGVEFLSNIKLGTGWLSGDGDNEGVYVADNGNVGIGTASPANRLDVNGAAAIGSRLWGDFTAGADYFWMGLRGSGADGQRIAIGINGANDTTGIVNSLHFHTNGAERMMIKQDGKVGIGTAGPTTNLTVRPAAAALSSMPSGWGGGIHTWDLYANGTVGAGKNGNVAAYMSSNGQIYAAGAFTSDAGTIRDAGGGWVRTYGNTGWYSQTYGGGWHMTDTTWLRAYNNKNVYTGGAVRGDGGIHTNQICNTSGNNCIAQSSLGGASSCHVSGYANCESREGWAGLVPNPNPCPGNKFLKGMHSSSSTSWMYCCDIVITCQ